MIWKKILKTRLCDIGSFFRIWSFGSFEFGPENEGHLEKVFVVSTGLKCAFTLGQVGKSIDLVGGQVLNVSGDRI